MTTNNTRMKVFRRARDIMDYYDMSRPAFEHYVKMGMPVRLIGGCYHGPLITSMNGSADDQTARKGVSERDQ